MCNFIIFLIIFIIIITIYRGIPELKLFCFCFPPIHTFFYLSVQSFALTFMCFYQSRVLKLSQIILFKFFRIPKSLICRGVPGQICSK